MPAPICKSCQSPRCGNHAACARRASQKPLETWKGVLATLSHADALHVTKQAWLMVWLYIGVHAYLELTSAIEDAEVRGAEVTRCSKEMTTDYLRFLLLATDANAHVREQSWDLGLKIVRA